MPIVGRRTLPPVLALAALVATATASQAQEDAGAPAGAIQAEAEVPTAPVEVDGVELFSVRGVTSYPAAQRAAAIAGRIVALAADPGFATVRLEAAETDLGVEILGGGHRLMLVTEADAELERVSVPQLVGVYRPTIEGAIERYRGDRSPARLRAAAGAALAATAVLALVLPALFWLARRLSAAVQRRLQQRIRALAIGSFELVRAERIRGALAGALRFARALVALALVFFYLGFVLGQFPWTRGAAQRLSGWVAGPLASMGRAVVAKIPDLIFLAILYLIVRWILRLMRLFFQAVAKREVAIAGFETEWADPTYKLLRLAVVAFAVVVAYPYIPGSASPAFKGISLFLGVVFSLGSSSTISNLIAGYTMTYRRAFRIGDMVKVGGMLGEVVEIRLQATHLRTPKNEEVILPNSSILTSEVVNYSSFAKQRGLILHTTVGIGYETPWRQVEAMLIQAAERTPGVLREPPPFVWQTALGDFAVTYQLNAYAQEALAMGRLYSALHRHILDVFNEYGVQIMTPAYEGDPEQPKVVPKEQWFTSPAAVPGPEPERGPDQ